MCVQRISAQGFLFDLDGVLADSREEVEAHWREFSSWYGLDIEELLTRTHGVRDSETIERELAGRPADEIQSAIERFRRLEVTDTERTVEVPGASVLLKSLPSERTCLVTSCMRPLAEARLGAVDIQLPKHRVFADDVRSGKPDPEPYVTGAARLGLDIAHCVVFEDSEAGLQSAAASGATPIGVATTQDADALREQMGSGALIVRDLSDVSVEEHDGLFVLTLETVF